MIKLPMSTSSFIENVARNVETQRLKQFNLNKPPIRFFILSLQLLLKVKGRTFAAGTFSSFNDRSFVKSLNIMKLQC